MQWKGRRQSSNVDDRRGVKTMGVLGGGGLIVAIIYAFLTGDPSVIVSSMLNSGSQRPELSQEAQEDQKEFLGVVLADTEDAWQSLFASRGQSYEEPHLVLFRGQVGSACGQASSAVGPFYCPSDRRLYLDTAFFEDLSQKMGAKGDFAQAYVIAHEVGHHVQNLLGTMDRLSEQRGGMSPEAANRVSVQVELQADCYAGIWAHTTQRDKQVLDADDHAEAINAAAAVGDDRLQQQGQGYVVPDSFTHGTSEQRVSWFERGYRSGNWDDCDTFTQAIGSR